MRHVMASNSASRQKAGLKNFEKGVSGNPKGRPKVLPELRGISPMLAQDFKRLITKYLKTPYSDLIELQKDFRLEAVDLLIITTLSKAIRTGDYSKVAPLMDRVIGRVKEESEMSISYDAQLAQVPPKDLISYLRERKGTAEIVIDSES